MEALRYLVKVFRYRYICKSVNTVYAIPAYVWSFQFFSKIDARVAPPKSIMLPFSTLRSSLLLRIFSGAHRLLTGSPSRLCCKIFSSCCSSKSSGTNRMSKEPVVSLISAVSIPATFLTSSKVFTAVSLLIAEESATASDFLCG